MTYFRLLAYNNYYNRQFKRETSLIDYDDASTNVAVYTGTTASVGVNFNPNDGISTFHIIPWTNSWNPDYLVVYDYDPVEQESTIKSRWFILEMTRTRAQQYRIELRRDVLADNIDAVKGATAYIERGTPIGLSDYSIYNRENFNFNEIKKSEKLLKDASGVGWLVGYYKTSNPKSGSVTLGKKADIVIENASSWTYSTPYKYIDSVTFKLYANSTKNGLASHATFTLNDGYTNESGDLGYNANCSYKNLEAAYNSLNANSVHVMEKILEINTGYHSELPDPSIKVGTIIYNKATQVYSVVNAITTNSTSITITPTADSAEEQYYNSLMGDYWTYPVSRGGDANTQYVINYTTYTYALVTASFDTADWSLPSTSVALNDAPYKMFAIPYGITNVYQYDTTPATKVIDGTISKDTALDVARDIAEELGTECYDIQLLPYFPMPEFLMGGGRQGIWIGINTTADKLKEDSNYAYIDDAQDNHIGIIMFPYSSNFSSELTTDIQIPSSISEFKIDNEVDKYRLVSPNYNGMFEFKKTFNNKRIVNFKYSCTYKPYNPFINVYPTPLSGLYGNDYGDNFGLICGGDFSITIMNSEWKQYQLNNKNYDNSFNRQLQTLDLNIKQAKVTNVTGAISGTVQGASMGMMATGGSPVGAIVGGVVSGAAGVADVVMANEKMQDQRNATVDQHFYELQNVQARPLNLTKVSTVDINNKIFPILEHYSCSDDEKNILKEFLTYKGYTINRIAQVESYWKNYLRCHIIRIPEIEDDYHLVSEISNELNKGVYTDAS